MLTGAVLRNLKPKSKIYKASDRDGMYVTVLPSDTATFHYDYRLHGRRETLTLGRNGPNGISLAMGANCFLRRARQFILGLFSFPRGHFQEVSIWICCHCRIQTTIKNTISN